MVTAPGTVMLPVDVNGTVPPDGHAPFNVTVQADDAPGPRINGVHANPLIAGSAATPIAVPPEVVVAIASAPSVAPSPPPTPIVADAAPGASVTATRAITPSAMTLPLIPLATQRYPFAVSTHIRPFPASVSAGPAVTATLLTCAGE